MSFLTRLLAIVRFTITSICPFCSFSPAYLRVICNTFILTFLGIFISQPVIRTWARGSLPCCLTSLVLFIHCPLMSFLTRLLAIVRFTITSICPFCSFSPAYLRVICNTFILTFLGIFISQPVIRTWARGSLPCTPICDSEKSRNTPNWIFLFACSHKVIPFGWRMLLNYWVVVIRLLIYHLH